MMRPIVTLSACASVVAATCATGQAGPGEKRARVQPSVPANYTELPFVEDAPEPTLTDAEKGRGYLLFQRPITEPVHPNTRPLTHERLEGLTAFATPGEFEPLNFSIYPTRDLVDLRVGVSGLSGPAGEIREENVAVRLQTYWNVGYPRYTSRDTYRRLGELLEEVTVHSSPAGECQRWWITVRVPEGTAPGLYEGTVTVEDGESDETVEIPIALRVLGFSLKRDPAKSYSVYYYVRNGVQYGDKDEDFVRQATANEYEAMVEYGIDMCPTLYLSYDEGLSKIVVAHSEELERLLAAGMGGPIPVTGDRVIGALYQKTTPGGDRGSHWKVDPVPPDEFYEQVRAAFAAFEAERKGQGWPEFICCPIDEVHSSRQEFGARVYGAVREAGMRTYITKDPVAADASGYRSAIDIWCSQPYSVTYEQITGQDRYEYWCYPNHNAGEIKDRRVMCKGGRMTYGFGFWRSGYTTLIPWHWAWTPEPDQFDYLRGIRSGCGNRIGDDGEVIPAVYWECFREGRDDARYIYTLQQAVWEREGSPDEVCRGLVANGKSLLQTMWSDIDVQTKYLADDMWPSEEFGARRWRLAMATQALLEHPVVREGDAPSVLVAETTPASEAGARDLIAQATDARALEVLDLGGDFSEWQGLASEGTLSVSTDAGKDGKPGLRWEVAVDHAVDGEGGDAYPIGWPRIFRPFAAGELDMTRYDYLLYDIRVDSDRDEVADDSTPVGFTIHSNKFYESSRDLGGHQQVWLPVLFPVDSLIETVGRGEEPWRSIERVQIFLAESNYADGTNLTFDIGGVSLLRFTTPMIRQVDAPRYALLPRSTLAVGLEVMGTRSVTEGSHTVTARLTDGAGQVRAEVVQGFSAGEILVIDTASVTAGPHTLQVTVSTADGRTRDRIEQPIEFMAGPLTRK